MGTNVTVPLNFSFAQTANGDLGLHGLPAVKPVEVAIRPSLENATTHLLPMEVLTALILAHLHKVATPKHVL